MIRRTSDPADVATTLRKTYEARSSNSKGSNVEEVKTKRLEGSADTESLMRAWTKYLPTDLDPNEILDWLCENGYPFSE